MAIAELDSKIASEVDATGAAPDTGAPGGDDFTTGVGDVTGETAGQGLRLPRLQITYGVGNLAKTFAPGDIVYGGDNLLAHKQEKLTIVIFKAVEYWREYMDSAAYDAGLRPRNFATEAEANANGGITKWPPRGSDGPKPNFSPAMDISMLIEKPANIVCGLFGIEIENKEYGVAIWTVDKTTYRRVAPYLKMCRQFSLRKRGLLSGRFELHTTIEQIGGRVGPVPNLRLAGHTSDEFIASVSAMLGVPVASGAELPPAAETAQLTA